MESKHGLGNGNTANQAKLLIEPVWNRNHDWNDRHDPLSGPFNRTSMESKLDIRVHVQLLVVTFNRTSMESKPGAV